MSVEEEKPQSPRHQAVAIPKAAIGSWDREWWQAVCSCGWSSTLHQTLARAEKSCRDHERRPPQRFA